MKFFYTALTTDNKKITGVLDTPDRENATAELHKMGVAILSVNEISEEEYVKFQKGILFCYGASKLNKTIRIQNPGLLISRGI